MKKWLLLGFGPIGMALSNHLQLSQNCEINIVSRQQIANTSKFIVYPEVNALSVSTIREIDGIIVSWKRLSTEVISAFESLKPLLKPNVLLINLSSASIYGNGCHKQAALSPPSPVNGYGLDKLQMERYLEEQFKNATLIQLRISNLYGMTTIDDFIQKVFHAIQFSEPLTLINGGNNVRDFLLIDDLLEAVSKITAIYEGASLPGKIDVCSGVGTTSLEVIKKVEAIMDEPVSDFIYLDNSNHIVVESSQDPTLMIKVLGIVPTKLDLGLSVFRSRLAGFRTKS